MLGFPLPLLRTPVGEEGAELVAAGLCIDTALDAGVRVQGCLGEQVDDRTRRTCLRVCSAENDPGQARMHQRHGTHGTGLQRHVQVSTGQAVVGHTPRRITQRQDFCMSGRIRQGDRLIEPPAQHLPGLAQTFNEAGRDQQQVRRRAHCLPWRVIAHRACHQRPQDEGTDRYLTQLRGLGRQGSALPHPMHVPPRLREVGRGSLQLLPGSCEFSRCGRVHHLMIVPGASTASEAHPLESPDNGAVSSTPSPQDAPSASATARTPDADLMTPLHAVIGMIELALHQPMNPLARSILSRSVDAAHTLRGLLQKLPLEGRHPSEAAAPEPVASRKLMQRAVAALPPPPQASQRWLQVDPAWPAGLMVIDQLWRELIIALYASVEAPSPIENAGAATILHLCAPDGIGWARLEIERRGAVASTMESPSTALDNATRRLGGHLERLHLGPGSMGWRVHLPLPPAPLRELVRVGDDVLAPLATGLLPLALALHHEPPSPAEHEPLQTLEPLIHPGINTLRSAASAGPLHGLRILVVDDVENNRIVTGGLLEEAGAWVEVATDGQQALDRLTAQQTGDLAPIDLVLMDCQMPVMDGMQATRHIRRDLGLTQLPILALTANSSQTERTSSLAAGMDDHLSKPLSSKSLVRAVLRHVQATGSRRQGEVDMVASTPPSMDTPSDDVPAQASAHDDSQSTSPTKSDIDALARSGGLDLNQVEVLFGGMSPLFIHALGRCVAEGPQHLEELRALRESQDRPALRRWLHARSGVWASLGLTQLSQDAQATLGSTPGSAQEADARLDPLAQRLTEALTPLAQVHARLQAQAAPSVPNPRQMDLSNEDEQAALEQLLQLLKAWDMDALRVYESLRDRLVDRLGPSTGARLDGHLARLQFAEAALCLADPHR